MQNIKNTFNEIKKPFLYVINTSLLVGSVPQSLKVSSITPVSKFKNPVNATDYRPINNNLPTIEKLLELTVKQQVEEHFTRNKLIVTEQSGFRNKHSCESAVQLLINQGKRAIDRNDTIITIFLDLPVLMKQ